MQITLCSIEIGILMMKAHVLCMFISSFSGIGPQLYRNAIDIYNYCN